MYKTIAIQYLIFIIGLCIINTKTLAEGNPSAAHILREADRFRLSEGSVNVMTQIRQFKTEKNIANNTPNKERLYQVLIKPNRRSLVIFKSSSEAGQKVLMLDDNYWLLMPKSRRPIRITPMQKLLGEVSAGDISNMIWSEDYQGVLAEENQYNGQPSLTLELTAKTASINYQRIELTVHKTTYQPLHANLYLKSGKLAKEAIYELGELNDTPRITRMTLFNRISGTKKTEINYLQMTPFEIPDKLYNPAYLARNPNSRL